ncbi:maleylpyruvate isomerase N-terminal domain-containing protein [Streptomyces sp. 1222.5]|uniref:maleylpyruvate isomerase N-terminal domain-containing protein n=1 Tax=Streptomyces sp. 1222.5 TaxID=1881026 RepID=UPI003D721ED6
MRGSPVFRAPDDALLDDVERSGDRLVRAAAGLSAADLRGPSGLASWTRGRVLAHVRHSAEAYVRLLHLARTGREPGPRADTAAPAAAVERDGALSAGGPAEERRVRPGWPCRDCSRSPSGNANGSPSRVPVPD